MSMDGIRYLSGVPLFVGLAPKALAGLAAHTRLVSFSAGDTVVEMDAGTPLFVVLDGHVRIADAAAGSSLAPILLGPGECFGDRALLNGEPCRASVEASEDVRLLMLSRPRGIGERTIRAGRQGPLAGQGRRAEPCMRTSSRSDHTQQ